MATSVRENCDGGILTQPSSLKTLKLWLGPFKSEPFYLNYYAVTTQRFWGQARGINGTISLRNTEVRL